MLFELFCLKAENKFFRILVRGDGKDDKIKAGENCFIVLRNIHQLRSWMLITRWTPGYKMVPDRVLQLKRTLKLPLIFMTRMQKS